MHQWDDCFLEKRKKKKDKGCDSEFWVERDLGLLCFTLLRPLIGPENSYHPLNQSDAKLQPFTSAGHSRIPALLFWVSHWLLILPELWLASVITYSSHKVKPSRLKRRKTRLTKSHSVFSLASDWIRWWRNFSWSITERRKAILDN